jgi:hypothetical protein
VNSSRARRQKRNHLLLSYASTLPQRFATFAERSVAGVLVAADPFFTAQRAQVLALANKLRSPAIYQWREFADAGGRSSIFCKR